MIPNQIKSPLSNKNKAPYLKLKVTFNIQYCQKAFSPIPKIFNSPVTISLPKGNLSPKLYKICFLGD